MRFFRLTPVESRLDSLAWRSSAEQRECCIVACCEPAARHTASMLLRAEAASDALVDAASPWLLPHLVTCARLAEVPALTTDSRLTAAQRSALQQDLPIEVPALAAQIGGRPASQSAAEATLVQALAALVEAFQSVGQPEVGQRMLASVAQAWSAVTPPAPAMATLPGSVDPPGRAPRLRRLEQAQEA